jgi:transposase
MTHSIEFWQGHGLATWDIGAAKVEVGDRLIPERISVTVLGGPSTPDFSMRIEVRQGIPVCTEMTLTARPDGPEVRDKDLKYLRLDDWLEQIVALASMKFSGSSPGGVTNWAKPVDDVTALRDIRRIRPGRPRKMTRERLQRIADVYRQHVDGRPTDAVAKAFGVSPRTAARHVGQARDAGLLPPTTPGKKKA